MQVASTFQTRWYEVRLPATPAHGTGSFLLLVSEWAEWPSARVAGGSDAGTGGSFNFAGRAGSGGSGSRLRGSSRLAFPA
jgi:hypothetical protein